MEPKRPINSGKGHRHSDEQEWQQKASRNGRNRPNYRLIKVIGQGTFGRVYLAATSEGVTVAIKVVLNDQKYKCREVELMSSMCDVNIVGMLDHYTTDKGKETYTNIVMEYMPETLLGLFRRHRKNKTSFTELDRKIYCFQLFKAFSYMHARRICHRDLKPANILIDSQRKTLKICDMGSAKELQPNKPNVCYICSRYYRAPELLLGYGRYGTEIDLWSIGCILVEFLVFEPIFPGESSLEQMLEIIKFIGTPSPQTMERYCHLDHELHLPEIKKQSWARILRKYQPDQDLVDLIQKLLIFEGKGRLEAKQALMHPYFDALLDHRNLEVTKQVPGLFQFHELVWMQLQNLDKVKAFRMAELSELCSSPPSKDEALQSIISTSVNSPNPMAH